MKAIRTAGVAPPASPACSPAARYIHGAVLNLDGGWLAR